MQTLAENDQKQPDANSNTDLNHQYFKNPLWQDLLAYFRLPNAESNLSKISLAFSRDINEIAIAVHGLQEMGLLQLTSKGFVAKKINNIALKSEGPDHSQRVNNHLTASLNGMNRLLEGVGYFGSYHIASNRRKMKQLQIELHTLLQKYQQTEDDVANEDVFTISFHCAAVTNSKTTKLN